METMETDFERLESADEENSVFEIEEVTVEEMAIDGIWGVY